MARDWTKITIEIDAVRQGRSLFFHTSVDTLLDDQHKLSGVDCACEPRVVIPHDMPKARVFFHRSLRGVQNGAR